MRKRLVAAALCLMLAGCQSNPDTGSADNSAAMADTGVTNGSAAGADLVFCKEIDRRTTQADCDDLTETAQQARAGTAAFNVPDMVRGQPSTIELAISLTPPAAPADEGMNATAADEGGDMDSAMMSAANDSAPMPEERHAARRDRADTMAGDAPADVVKDLPGRTEQYSPVTGRDMRAELIGEGFRIEPLGPASQVLNPGSTTSWEWRVTPLAGTDYALTVKTSVEGVMADGAHVVLGSTTQTRTVKVAVRWSDRFRDWLVAIPIWLKLVGGVLLALGGLFGAWWTMMRAAKGESVLPSDKDKDGGKE